MMMYNDGDPLSADDHSYIVDHVFNYHLDKVVKMGTGIDYVMVIVGSLWDCHCNICPFKRRLVVKLDIQNAITAVSGSNGMQAVALRIAGDKAMLYGVRILGTHDTLLDDTVSHYFYKCYIQGTVDFVFGRARLLYKDCILHSTAERFGAIATHHRGSPFEDTGFSFINSTINGSGTVYLGRAWRNYSRAIFAAQPEHLP